MVFLFQTWSKHTFVEPKMERKYATEYLTAVRNGCLSPKSDDNMNGSCVKTQTLQI